MTTVRKAALAVLALTILPHKSLAAGDADPLMAAAAAYEAGRCAEVLSLYSGLPGGATLDGVSQYRWGFCLAEQRQPGAEERYTKAAEVLGREAAGARAPLLVHFYRVNALLNLERKDEAKDAALTAIAAWKAGQLTVPADDAVSWFRLGKLTSDSGDAKGALDPFRRAIAIAASQPGALRQAYLERIGNYAREQGDTELSAAALAELEKVAPSSPKTLLQRAQLLIEARRWDEAKALLDPAGRGPSDEAMSARYTAGIVDRAREVDGWKLAFGKQTANGRAFSSLKDEELLQAIAEAGAAGYRAMSGASREVARKRQGGTRPVPTPATAADMQQAQAVFVGALLEALRRSAPLQEWAVQGGFPLLIYQPWETLFNQRLEQSGERQTAEPD